jgi:hypothetical protein
MNRRALLQFLGLAPAVAASEAKEIHWPKADGERAGWAQVPSFMDRYKVNGVWPTLPNGKVSY